MAITDVQTLETFPGGAAVLWEQMAGGDTGEPLKLNRFAGAVSAVQAIGTFGGTLTMQGSIDGTNWVDLTTTAGDAASLTAAGGIELGTAFLYIRPSAGAGISDVDVYLCIRGG